MLGDTEYVYDDNFEWDANTLSLLQSLPFGNGTFESEVLTFHKYEDELNNSERDNPANNEDANQLYLVRSTDNDHDFSESSGSNYCDLSGGILNSMLKEEINGETLSSFIGNIAGTPFNDAELVEEAERGSKSYEKDINEKYSLKRLLKRPILAPPHLAPLDEEQMEGFQLLSSSVAPTYNNTRCPDSESDEALYESLARENLKCQRSKRRIKRKIVVTYQKTSENLWEQKVEPQKIVPIRSEQISGMKVYRREYRRHITKNLMDKSLASDEF